MRQARREENIEQGHRGRSISETTATNHITGHVTCLLSCVLFCRAVLSSSPWYKCRSISMSLVNETFHCISPLFQHSSSISHLYHHLPVHLLRFSLLGKRVLQLIFEIKTSCSTAAHSVCEHVIRFIDLSEGSRECCSRGCTGNGFHRLFAIRDNEDGLTNNSIDATSSE